LNTGGLPSIIIVELVMFTIHLPNINDSLNEEHIVRNCALSVALQVDCKAMSSKFNDVEFETW